MKSCPLVINRLTSWGERWLFLQLARIYLLNSFMWWASGGPSIVCSEIDNYLISIILATGPLPLHRGVTCQKRKQPYRPWCTSAPAGILYQIRKFYRIGKHQFWYGIWAKCYIIHFVQFAILLKKTCSKAMKRSFANYGHFSDLLLTEK